MIQLLEHCVRIPSLSGQEMAVAEFLRDQMLARGFDRAFVDQAGNAVGILGDGPRQAVLLGHMDTVGGDVPVRYENAALYGRGAVDAKGPLCAFILAAAALRQTAHALGDRQIIVVGATEEEAVTSRGARYAAAQYHPEWCIIGEPSGADGITLGYKGRLLAEARFQMPSRHTAVPGPGVNEQAVAFWNRIDDFARSYNQDKPKVFDQILPSLRQIQSGGDGNAEWCDVLAGFRLPMEFGPHRLESELRSWQAGNDARPPLPALQSLACRGHEAACRSPKDTPLARAFVDAIRAAGMRPAFKHKTGTSDFNVVAPIWNCPIVAYGPGDSSLDHTPDEHVEVAEFETSVSVLAQVIGALSH